MFGRDNGVKREREPVTSENPEIGMSATDHRGKRARTPVTTVKREIGTSSTDNERQEDKKLGSHINVKVKNGNGDDLFFKIRRNMELSQLMTAYSDRVSPDFLFNGKRLPGDKTPDELEMEDGDEIEAILVLRQKPDPNLIRVKLKALNGDEVFLMIERNKQLSTLMRDFCKGQEMEFDTHCFCFAGRWIKEKQTPNELGMKDGDVIYVII